MIRITFASFILILIASPAYAYIDVAIGGLILQALVGGFFAFLVVWRHWIEKFKNFFRGKGFKLETPPEASTTNKAESLEACPPMKKTET